MSRDQVERAEANTRTKMTETDKRKYSGVARHPLARRWLLQRLIESRENSEAADSDHARKRWDAETDRVTGELRRMGVSLESGE